jgi:hypothetical protein
MRSLGNDSQSSLPKLNRKGRRPAGTVPSDRVEITPSAEKVVEKLQHDLEKAKDASRDAEKDAEKS